MILNSSPLVSVIVTTFNRSNFLAETIHSIANQTYRPIEILIVDDGSTDEVAIKNQTLCKKYINCKYFYKPNSGQPDSRNYGIKKAKGDYIGFCDDDDMWLESKIERQLNIFYKYPEIGIVSGSTEYVSHKGERTDKIKSHGVGKFKFEDFLLKNRIQSPTPLIKKEVFSKVGYFNSTFTIAEDWEFWRRVSYYYEAYNINEVLGYVRLHDANMSLSRENSPMERILLYHKLTTSLLIWGKEKFSKDDFLLIEKTEWLFYKRMLTNHFFGISKKIKFIIFLGKHNFKAAYHLIKLALKFEIFK